jgi:squalene-hopene/tetraprenyl-beta-curcumene cyclase
VNSFDALAAPAETESPVSALPGTDERWKAALDATIGEAASWLAGQRAEDGHWVFELEADATIPAEYILLNHYLDEIDDDVERKLAAYLRATQADHGGWPLFHGGDFDISASVKAYYALKLTGEDIDAPHMARARAAILAFGGAAKSNVFTRTALALFGQVPWRAVPVMRVEAVLLPRWSPFHIDKVSYWSRTVMVPLLILCSRRARAKNPRGIGIAELFVTPPNEERHYINNPTGHWLGALLVRLDRVIRRCEPYFPRIIERKATETALAFVKERLNGEDGLGGIFPAMANALMVFDLLGYAKDHPDYVIARRAVDKLLTLKGDWGYVQPCLSPIWDTGLAALAMMEAGYDGRSQVTQQAMDWLRGRQILDVKGDWKANRADVRPGGWAFQYWNDHYPDVDDTAVVVMAMHRADQQRYQESIARATEWIIGMQSKNGGWGAFDADNEYYFLENIPFADHGALLDPPTVDVSARCIGMLAQLGYGNDHPTVKRGLDYLRREQEEDGSWFGRWGTNYIYGTWSALSAFNAAGEDPRAPHIRRAVKWLEAAQRPDGGWGEDCATYWRHRRGEAKTSTPSQTAWAVLGLMAAGEVRSEAVRRGIDFLLTAPRDGGKWEERFYNAVGFPRVFYLSYHGYSAYFALWALARYRNMMAANAKTPAYGI